MTGPRFSRECQCDGKRRFSHKSDAKNAARLVERRHGRQHPYRCPHCGFWHIGHRVKPEFRRRSSFRVVNED